MSAQKHTPGPWHFDGKTVSAKGQPNVCRLENGHLIAAAPDLLEALYAALPCVEESEEFDKPHGPKLSIKIRALLAKAEGVK